MHSAWRGFYQCSQGRSAISLVLDAGSGGALSAVFEFGPTPENTTVATGSYRLRGSVRAGREGTFEVVLEPEAWIDEPDGYVMTGLEATSSRKWQRMVGKINHPSCGEVDVRRAD
jgi:hypothetical protein